MNTSHRNIDLPETVSDMVVEVPAVRRSRIPEDDGRCNFTWLLCMSITIIAIIVLGSLGFFTFWSRVQTDKVLWNLSRAKSADLMRQWNLETGNPEWPQSEEVARKMAKLLHGVFDQFGPNKALTIQHGCPEFMKSVTDSILNGLPENWPVFVVMFQDNAPCIRNLLESVSANERLWLVEVPINQTEFSILAYNIILQLPEFYKSVGGKHLLVYQHDSVICSKSPHKIDDFLQYSYIGAQWPQWGGAIKGGNGGFSLRHVPSMIKVYEENLPSILAEDLYLSCLMQYDDRFKLPDVETGNHFSIEAASYDRPFAMHQTFCQFRGAQLVRFREHCPEIDIFIDGSGNRKVACPSGKNPILKRRAI